MPCSIPGNDVQVAEMFLYAAKKGVFTKQFMDDLYYGLDKIRRAKDPVVLNPDFIMHAKNIVLRLTKERQK